MYSAQDLINFTKTDNIEEGTYFPDSIHPLTVLGTYNGQLSADPELFSDLSEEKQKVILEWIKENFLPTKKTPHRATSYQLKHILERAGDEQGYNFYLTDNQFKDAMLIAGFEPTKSSRKEVRWHFCISKKSPAFLADAATLPKIINVGEYMQSEQFKRAFMYGEKNKFL